MSKELDTVKGGNEVALPSLYEPVDVTDIQLPQVKLMYGLSDFVAKKVASPGDVVLAFGNDDPSPQFLIGGPDNRTSFTAFVLDRDKTAARAEPGQQMEWQTARDYNDPYSQDVWFFYLAIPEFEALIPARQMLWKAAGAPAARQINTLIARAQASGATDPVAVKFTVSSKKSRNGMHTYDILQAQPTDEFSDTDLEVARQLYTKLHEVKAHVRYDDNSNEFSDQPNL